MVRVAAHSSSTERRVVSPSLSNSKRPSRQRSWASFGYSSRRVEASCRTHCEQRAVETAGLLEGSVMEIIGVIVASTVTGRNTTKV